MIDQLLVYSERQRERRNNQSPNQRETNRQDQPSYPVLLETKRRSTHQFDPMNQPDEHTILTSRLLPRLSIRFLLTTTFFFAILASTARVANSGGIAAQALLFAVLALASFFGLSCLLFLLARILDLGNSSVQETANPYDSESLPPQILPPRDHQS
jgi:hypothetical protein